MNHSETPRPPEGDWLGTPYLRFERSGPIAIVTIDRPDKRNALSPAMYFGIRVAIDIANRDEDLIGLIITGVGDVFIPGGDLSWSYDDNWMDLPNLLGFDNTPFDAIRNSVKPVVSAVNGLAQGGGLIIAMLSDLTVASDRATFRAPELLRGIADTNYAQLLPRQIGPARARDMLFTGRVATATEALQWGLVSRVVPHEDVLQTAKEVLVGIHHAAPVARAQLKRVMDDFYGHHDRMTMDASLRADEAIEGWEAFRDRRAPNWISPELRPEHRL